MSGTTNNIHHRHMFDNYGSSINTNSTIVPCPRAFCSTDSRGSTRKKATTTKNAQRNQPDRKRVEQGAICYAQGTTSTQHISTTRCRRRSRPYHRYRRSSPNYFFVPGFLQQQRSLVAIFFSFSTPAGRNGSQVVPERSRNCRGGQLKKRKKETDRPTDRPQGQQRARTEGSKGERGKKAQIVNQT